MLRAIQIDVVLHYLTNKPKIDDSSIKIEFRFKRKVKTHQDEMKCVTIITFYVAMFLLFLNPEFPAPWNYVNNLNLMSIL